MTTALLTGGSAGIGRAIGERLVADGLDVVSLDRQPAAWRHERLQSVAVDLLDRTATAAALKAIATKRPATVVVHNAGAIRPAAIGDVTLDDFDALAQLHIGAAMQVVQSALPAMRAARAGRIVLIGSRAGLGLPTRSAYSATKAGLIGLARTWALELARDGVTVNVVAPGPIRGTDLFHGVVPKGSEQEQRLAASVPVGRLGEPADVARAVAFFVDAASSFVTGQVLYVCGGTSVGSLVV